MPGSTQATLTSETTTVTVHDEGTREALLGALWCATGAAAGDPYDLGIEASYPDKTPEDLAGVRAELIDRIALLVQRRSMVERIERADLGETIELEVPVEEVRRWLRNTVLYIEHDGLRERAAEHVRPQVIAIHDAARRVLSELPVVEVSR